MLKTERSKEEFDKPINILKQKIKIMPNEETEEFMLQAEKICPDKKDIDYFALALKLKCPLWSNNRILKTKQNVVIVYSSEELI